MSRTLYVVRHGETDYNRTGRLQGRSINAPLNATGIHQAGLAAAFLSTIPVDFIAASSLERALHTARIIAAPHGLTPHSDAGLDEMDFGRLEGQTYGEAEADLTRLRNAWRRGDLHLGPDGGESPQTVFERADAAARRFLETNPFQQGVFVVHGRLIRILLSGWTGIGLHRMEEIQHTNAAVNILQYREGRFVPVELNITRHLESVKTTFV